MDSIIAYLKDFLYSHRLTSLVGLLTFIMLFWFASPSLGITQLITKIIIIISLVSIYCIIILGYWLWSYKKRKVLSKQVTAEQVDITGKQEQLMKLKEKMQSGITALKMSMLGKNYRGTAALYALPWYVVIGPATAGKSTFLRNSNLHFSLMNQDDNHSQTLDSTHNCDWLFSEEAVLIDTAGRYMASSDDHEEWLTFLEILQKKKSRLPNNGILVVFSIATLLLATEQDILNHSKIIRDRIEEIYQKLKFIIPVYIIFNKVDVLPGFHEFFSDLNEEERCQVWGVTVTEPYQKTDRCNYFSQKLEELYATLTHLRMYKLAVERDQRRKLILYHFPEQFIATHGRLHCFLNSFLRKNPYQETPEVHGIYFTSSIQNNSQEKPNSESQDLTGILTSPTATIAKEEKIHSYFIASLLRHVIFKNGIQLARPHGQLLLLRWLKSASVMVSISLIIGTAFLYITSFTANTILLHRSKIVVEQVMSDLSDNSDHIYYSLRVAFNFYTQLISNQKMLPWYLRLGLYRTDTEIPIYQKLLNQSFVRIFQLPLQNELETKLNKFSYLWQNNLALHERMRGDYYAYLRLYLMLCYPRYIDFNFVRHELLQFWLADLKEKMLYVDLNQDKNLIAYYLTQLKKNTQSKDADMQWHPKSTIVIKARQQLATPTGIENLYAFMVRRGLEQLGYLTLPQLITHDQSDLLFSTFRLPFIYTRKGWQEYISPMIEKITQTEGGKDWVIQKSLSEIPQPEVLLATSKPVSNDETAMLQRKLAQIYFENYTQTWLNLINFIQIKPFTSFDDAARQLDILSQRDSPLTQVLQVVTDNINGGYSNAIMQLSKQSFDVDRQAKFLNKSWSRSESKAFISADEKNSISVPLQNYLQQLSKIKNDSERLAASSDSFRDANLLAARLLNGTDNTNNLLQAMLAVDNVVTNFTDMNIRSAVKNLLLAPIRNNWRVILQATSEDLQRQWQQKILLPYQQTLANRFPFVRNQNDANFMDVVNFLRPETGDLWHFVNTDLAPYLVPNGNSWASHTWLGLGINFNAGFLQALNAGKKITEGLFQQGSETSAFNLQVYPIPTPGLSQITIENNGVRLNYRNGPQEWSALSWQGSANSDAALIAIAAHQAGASNISQQGVWALWRLLAQANLTAESGGIVCAQWLLSIQGKHYPIRFLFKTGNNNLLQEVLINGWRLPMRVIN